MPAHTHTFLTKNQPCVLVSSPPLLIFWSPYHLIQTGLGLFAKSFYTNTAFAKLMLTALLTAQWKSQIKAFSISHGKDWSASQGEEKVGNKTCQAILPRSLKRTALSVYLTGVISWYCQSMLNFKSKLLLPEPTQYYCLHAEPTKKVME